MSCFQHRLSFAIVISILATCLLLATDAVDKPTQLSLVLELKDGSRLIGVPSIDSISVRTPDAKIKLAFAKIRNIRFGEQDGVTLTLENGDRIHATTDMEKLGLQTLIGPTTIPIRLIARIQPNINNTPNPDGLILWLDPRAFTEKEWPDRSGQGCDGIPENIRISEEGFPLFNGNDSKVTIPRKQTPASITINVWAKKTTAHSLLSESIISCGVDNDLFIDSGEASRDNALWRGAIFTTKGIFQSVFLKERLGTRWIMFTMAYDGQTLTMYQNGTKCSSIVASGVIHTSSDHYVLGLRNEEAPHFSGYLGDVQIYNRALSPDEVEQNYEGSKNRFPNK